MPELRVNLGREGLAKFDEVKADLTRYFGGRQSSRVTLDVLCHLYQQLRHEGQLSALLSNYPGALEGIDVH